MPSDSNSLTLLTKSLQWHLWITFGLLLVLAFSVILTFSSVISLPENKKRKRRKKKLGYIIILYIKKILI